MAAQQEQIRNRLNELRNELSGDKESKNNIDKLLDQINKNQDDILNDNISQSTIQRQEQILTRLLQAEKAEMEREREKQRESNEWLNNLSKKILDPMEKYKKEKVQVKNINIKSTNEKTADQKTYIKEKHEQYVYIYINVSVGGFGSKMS